MPIRHFVSKLEDIPEGAQQIDDITDDYKSHHYFGERPFTVEAQERFDSFKMYAYSTHVGVCLYEREYNGYDDSDFYMIFWNEEKQAPESYMFATTRGWCQPCFGSRPDATPEVVAKYEAYKAEQERQARARQEEIERQAPRFGKTVVVTRTVAGRKPETKVEKGVTGEVFWTADIRYDFNKFVGRVGIRLADGSKKFTSASNVQVTA